MTGCGAFGAVRGGRPGPVAAPTVTALVLGGQITPADVPRLCERLRRTLGNTDAELLVCDVAAVTEPDLATVEALARLQLTATRLGGRLRLSCASRELRELLAFSGLSEVVPHGPVGHPRPG